MLDNARFHQSHTTCKLVEAVSCQLLFLPSCSPNFSSIEQLGAASKIRPRYNLPTVANFFLLIANVCQCCCQLRSFPKNQVPPRF